MVEFQNKHKARILLCLCLLFLFIMAFLGLPGRFGAEFSYIRTIWRLDSYQTILAGVLALIAGGSVIFAAVYQQESEKQKLNEQRANDELDIAMVILAEVKALKRAGEEFEKKFQSYTNGFQGRSVDGVEVEIILPVSTDVYKTVLKDLPKLPVHLTEKIVYFYSVFEGVYKPKIKQKFSVSAFTDQTLTEFKINILTMYHELADELIGALEDFVISQSKLPPGGSRSG